MALLIGGGFLISHNKIETAQAANTYTPVYTDNFATNSGDWVTTGSAWTIGGGSATAPLTGWNKPLVRPTSEDFKDGKVEFTFPAGTSSAANTLVARHINNAGQESYYLAWFWQSIGNIWIGKVINNSAQSSETNRIIEKSGANIPNNAKCELIVESNSPTESQITAKCYNDSGVEVASVTGVDSTAALQGAGSWGLTSYAQGQFKNFATYELTTLPAANSLAASAATVKTGQPITLTITGVTSDQTVSLSDGGAGGTFGTNSVVLNSGNQYTATATYTPSTLGSKTITANFSGGGTQATTVLAFPYSTQIGFIGDSISYGVGSGGMPNAVETEIAGLGSGFTSNNRATSGSTTATWVNSLLNSTLTSFETNGVEIVQIMLGTNDAAADFPAEVYESHMVDIITRLKLAGVKRIILNAPIYGDLSSSQKQLLVEYAAVLKTLVDGEKVFLGDVDAFDGFAQHCFYSCQNTWLADSVHPNAVGHEKLGEFWTAAFNRVITEPLSTTHQFTGANSGTFTKESATGLEYTVAKDFHWFNEGGFAGVLVDGVLIDAAKYTAAPGSTVITLAPTYLDTLAVGSHNLTVRFTDGVSFTSVFAVVAANTGGTNNGGSNGSNIPGAPNTGLFGLGSGVTITAFSILTTITAFGVVLVGWKLALSRK